MIEFLEGQASVEPATASAAQSQELSVSCHPEWDPTPRLPASCPLRRS